MRKTKKVAALIAAVFGAMGAHKASADIITQYSFSGTTPTPSSTEASTGGVNAGTATALGMTNSYTYAGGEGPGASDGSNIATTAGTAHPTFSESTYRIVGNSNTKNAGAGMANGWNNSAPDYTQGAEFTAPTTGYTPTSLSFDWYATTQGVGNLQVRYTLDGSTWTNLGSDYVATANDYYGAAGSSPNITVDLTTLPAGATDNPNFGVELVSVRPQSGDANFVSGATDPGETGAGQDGDYAAASGGSTNYNNSSGNWRFDNVTVSGTPTPEPASLSLIGLAGLALIKRRNRNQSV